MFLLARKLQAQLGWCWVSTFVQVSHHNLHLGGVINTAGEICMDEMVARWEGCIGEGVKDGLLCRWLGGWMDG